MSNMVPGIQQSIQRYQTFHRQTLNSLQLLEQDLHELRSVTLTLEPIYTILERIHPIKVGAQYLHLWGVFEYTHLIKGRFFALSTPSITLGAEGLNLLMQMQEQLRRCFLTNITTWQQDCVNILATAPCLFETLDAQLPVLNCFQGVTLSASALETDMQRMLVATVLGPELARLDMMVNNTPSSKLSEILWVQLPRIQTLVHQLKLEESGDSIQEKVLEIQARPSLAKRVGLSTLRHWSELCLQCLRKPEVSPQNPVTITLAGLPNHLGQTSALWDFREPQSSQTLALPLPLKSAYQGQEDTLIAEFEKHCLNIDSTPVPYGIQNLLRVIDLLRRCAAEAERNAAKAFAEEIIAILQSVGVNHTQPDPHWKFLLLQCFNYFQSLWPTIHPALLQTQAPSIDINKILSQLKQFVAVIRQDPQPLAFPTSSDLDRPLVNLFATELEARITTLAVQMIDANLDVLQPLLEAQIKIFLRLSQQQGLGLLGRITEVVQQALVLNPSQCLKICRLAIQNWQWYQLWYLAGKADQGENPAAICDDHLNEALLALSQLPGHHLPQHNNSGQNSESDSALLEQLEQVELPSIFGPLGDETDSVLALETFPSALPSSSSMQNEPSLHIPWQRVLEVGQALDVLKEELEHLPGLPPGLHESFEQLQDHYLHLRTLPLAVLFRAFQPMVDALGLQLGKQVQLQILGGEIRVDQFIAKRLHQPLYHLLSNGVIHGIESPEIRQQKGKPPTGSLYIIAYQTHGQLTLEIRDDGQGLNFGGLRQLVIDRLGLSSIQGQGLTEQELIHYLFSPGLRIRKQEGDSAQSLMGLDAVRELLQELKASVEVSTLISRGTTFRLQIPNAIAPRSPLTPPTIATEETDQTNLVRSSSDPVVLSEPSREPSRELVSSQPWTLSKTELTGSSREGPSLQLPTAGLFVWEDQSTLFCLACELIEEYVMPDVTEAHQTQSELLWRSRSLPIYTLQDFLGFEDNLPPLDMATDPEAVILVIKLQGQYLALRTRMSRLVSQLSLEVNPLSRATAAPRYILGVTLLAPDLPAVVIDVAALIQQQQVARNAGLLSPEEASREPSGGVSSGASMATLGKKNVPETGDPDADTAAERGMSIMIIDDSRTAREIVSMTLKQGGYTVIQAKDGLDALEQLRSGGCSVALIISDVAMPRMNGLEFLKACRQDQRLCDLPIAMLSNCDSATHSELATKAGANAYLTKPYDEGEFLQTIGTLLEQSVPVSQ